MSTTEKRPVEETAADCTSRGPVQILSARDVPLGGPRAMTVRRALPARERACVGAWCFVDHYGPDDVAATGGMDVPPHPHTGLQTVSWLFAGEVEHRDSLGNHAMVRPGEVNLMTAGHGIAHSEVSTADTRTLHGVQLWVVLPDAARDEPADFEGHTIPSVDLAPGVTGRVFVGELQGHASPVRTATPLLGAEIRLDAGSTWVLPVDPAFEHGVLVDHGDVTVEGVAVPSHDLGVLDAGRDSLTITTTSDAMILLLGGEPFGEEFVMWWNFVGRSHEEILRFREEWEDQSRRFGAVHGYGGEPARLPAPSLPNGRLRPRDRLGRRR